MYEVKEVSEDLSAELIDYSEKIPYFCRASD